jgi:hypothetical protein
MSEAIVVGQFFSQITDVPCQLKLELDNSGCIAGIFSADAEELQILGNHPKANGEFFAALRSSSGETVALLHAMPDETGLTLEFENPPTEVHDSSLAERVHFEKVWS